MKKFLSLLLLSASLQAQQVNTLTPNIGLQIPPYGSVDWQVPFDYNFYQIDLFLSGNLPLPSIYVTGQAILPGLTTWITDNIYIQGAVVWYFGQPYTSINGGNQGNLPTDASFWTPGISNGGGGGGTIPNTTLVLKGAGQTGVSTAAIPQADYLQPGTESVAFSTTPTFSTTALSSHIVMTGSISSFTLAGGNDGQLKCLLFVHDSSSTVFTVHPPSNVIGFFTPGNFASKRSQQCFIYFQTDNLWEAISSGVVNQ